MSGKDGSLPSGEEEPKTTSADFVTSSQTPERKRKRNSPDEGEGDGESLSKRAKVELDDSQADLDLADGSDELVKEATEDKRLADLLSPLYSLRKELEITMRKLPKPPTQSQTEDEVWGKLLPQFHNQPHIPLSGESFTIGRGPRCNLVIKDPQINNLVCRIQFNGGQTVLEHLGNGEVLINKIALKKQSKQQLRSEDELTVVASKPYTYIYKQLAETTSAETIKEAFRGRAKLLATAPKSNTTANTSTNTLSGLSPTTTTTLSQPYGLLDSQLEQMSSPLLPKTSPKISDTSKSGSSPATEDTLITSTKVVPMKQPSEAQLKFEEKVRQEVISSATFGTFDELPYHLDPTLKRLLISSVYIFLERPEYEAYTKEIPTLSRRILLAGEPGSQIFQETLVKALAKHFGANLYIMDDVGNEPPSKSGRYSPMPGVGPIQTLLEEMPFPEPTRVYKRGDQVRFVGYGNSLPNRLLRSLHSRAPSVNGAPPSPLPALGPDGDKNRRAGPSYGSTGKVVLTFDDNPRKVGVRFDRPIVGGVNLGGHCEDQHGFFVDASELRPDSDYEEPDFSATESIFSVLKQQKHQPVILFVKDLEKISSNYDHFAFFKKEVDKLTGRIVVIASSITARDGTKGGKGSSDRTGIVFSKSSSGGGHAALVDLSIFDRLSRVEGGKKESSSKAGKVISRLFPTQIEIHPPKEAAELSVWKKLLERDTLKMRHDANISSLRAMLEKNHLFCEDLEKAINTKKVLSRQDVQKIVGVALSHSVMNDVAPAPLESAPSTTLTSITTNTNPNIVLATAETNEKETETTEGETVGVTIAESEESNVQFDLNLPAEMVVEEKASTETAEEKQKETETEKKLERLVITNNSLQYALKMLQDSEPPSKKSVFDIETENEFEKRLLADVIPPNEIDLKFDDIGALDNVKETLRELVMLPLKRPELFRKGNLTKPCKGILLFGPPGTGKTMLAKAVATESGANFISISMASIGSKWFGEGERYARAVFTLASKISPCVIFIDEVDSILGRRSKSGEHEAMRKIKTEFMMMWDGLKTRDSERVLVLAATNRPFDLDEAVLRRLPRRLLIDLPDQKNRLKILQVILKEEETSNDLDMEEIAGMTEGFSGSDLKNFCVAAAYRPIRELLKQEREREKEGIVDMEVVLNEDGEVPTPKLRPLTMPDFKKAKTEVSASVSEDTFTIAELRKWNQQFGEGGKGNKSTLSYFT